MYFEDTSRQGVWINSKKETVQGRYWYNSGADTFNIELYVRCKYSGTPVRFITNDDDVGFGDWVKMKVEKRRRRKTSAVFPAHSNEFKI